MPERRSLAQRRKGAKKTLRNAVALCAFAALRESSSFRAKPFCSNGGNTMNENRTIHLAEIPLGGKEGFIWNRLHGEREDVCEAMLKHSASLFGEPQQTLQTRLRKIDDALDRLMSGSYGNCSKCGQAIDDSTLEIDPALPLCLGCSGGLSITGLTQSQISTAP